MAGPRVVKKCWRLRRHAPWGQIQSHKHRADPGVLWSLRSEPRAVRVPSRPRLNAPIRALSGDDTFLPEKGIKHVEVFREIINHIDGYHERQALSANEGETVGG